MKNTMYYWACVVLILIPFITTVHSHGRLLEPPARNTMWRFGFKTPPNYNDNELFCGGIGVSREDLSSSSFALSLSLSNNSSNY